MSGKGAISEVPVSRLCRLNASVLTSSRPTIRLHQARIDPHLSALTNPLLIRRCCSLYRDAFSMPCDAASSGAAPRERDMSAIGELWSLSVAGPFTTGSVQMTEAELVTMAAGIPDDVVGAKSLLISKGRKFDDQSAYRTRTDGDSHHDRRVSLRLREGETSSQRKRPSWRKNQKEWQAQDPYHWKKSRCVSTSVGVERILDSRNERLWNVRSWGADLTRRWGDVRF